MSDQMPLHRRPTTLLLLAALATVLLLTTTASHGQAQQPATAASASPAGAITLTIPVQQDTTIGPQWDGPLGNDTTLYASQANNGVNPWWALFQFDLSLLPPGGRIVSAQAHFHTLFSNQSPLTLHRIAQPWHEQVDSWSTISDGVEATPLMTLTPASAGSKTIVDITALARQWAQGEIANLGIAFKAAVDQADTRLASRESVDPMRWPYLVVEFEAGEVQTVADDFDPNTGFSGNDGTHTWTGFWTEQGEADGPAAGRVQVGAFGLCPAGACLRVGADRADISGYGASRQADLDQASWAVFSYRLRREGKGGSVLAQVSSDGGGNWTTLATHVLNSSDANWGFYVHDISAHLSTLTQIRFVGQGVTQVNGTAVTIDNVSIHFIPQGLSGRVWEDLDRSGGYDVGEPGLAGVRVRLYAGACAAQADAPVAIALTDAAGFYRFRQLTPGDYCVSVDPGTAPVDQVIVSGQSPRDVTLPPHGYVDGLDVGYASVYADTRLIAGLYSPCPDVAWLNALVQGYGGAIAQADHSACVFGVEVDAAQQQALQEAITADSRSRYCQPDVEVRGMFTPNDPLYSNPSYVYGPQQINAAAAWDLTTGDPSLIVAVLDSGIDAAHPEFAGRVLPGWDFANKDDNPFDDNGHGTHVTGILAAGLNNGIGIAGMANVQILPVKVLNADNTGWWSDVAAGITWAVDRGARVVNLSLSGSVDSQAMRDAVAYAVSKGVVVVAAAGNNGSQTPHYPASYENVISLVATTSNNVRWTLSNYGPNVDVMAPGATIYSTRPGNDYRFMSGTSMASPHGAGVAALMLSQNPNLTPAEVKAALQETAVDMGDPGPDALHGWGRIDAGAAVASVIPEAYLPPVTSLEAELYDDLNGDGLIDPGDTLRYRIVAANDNLAPLADVVIGSAIPPHTSYAPGSTTLNGIPVLDGNDINVAVHGSPFPLDEGGLNIGSVPARGSSVVAFDVIVQAPPRGVYQVVNKATVQSSLGLEEMSVESELAGTLLKLAVDETNAHPGDTLIYTITSDYVEDALLHDVTITAPTPAGTSYLAGSANAGGTHSSDAITWALGSNAAAVPGFSPGVSGSISLDSSSTTKGKANSFSRSHTTSGEHRLMLVGVSFLPASSSHQVDSVSYGAQTLTKLGQSATGAGGARVEIWALTAPNVGTANVVVTLSESDATVVGIATFTGVNQTNPYGAFFSNTSAGSGVSLNVSSATGELVFDTVDSSARADVSQHASQTRLWSLREDAASKAAASGGSIKPGAAAVTLSWSGASGDWAIGGVSIKPQPGPSLGSALSVAPTLVTAGSTLTVTMALTASTDIPNVYPKTLVITGTNGVGATYISGPTPASATVGASPTMFTWIYQAAAGANFGQLTFGGAATDNGVNEWPNAQSHTVIVHPPLHFSVQIDDPAALSDIMAGAFIADQPPLLPATASNSVFTSLQGSIRGRVWNDADGDNIQDPAEPGIPGSAVILRQDGVAIATAVTAADGDYAFSDLEQGTYTLQLDPSSLPPEFDLITTPYPLVITLQPGAIASAHFGLKARSISLGNTVWYDANGNGRQDAGEPGLGNVTLRLWLDNGDGVFTPGEGLDADTFVAATTTNAAGVYRLDAPVPGAYFIQVTDDYGILAGLSHSIGPHSISNPSPPITVSVGQAYQDADFGYVRVPDSGHGVAGDQVWIDANGDGIRQPYEAAAIGVEVCAAPAGGGDSVCAVTDLNGRYLLSLPAGDYSIAPTTPPLGLTPTIPIPLNFGLAAGQHILSLDFGYWQGGAPIGRIGGHVWQDLPVNGQLDGLFNPDAEPGIPNVSVDLILDLNGDGLWDAGEPYVATVTTLAGDYRFDGLVGGSYLVRASDTYHVLRNFAPVIATLTGSAPVDGASKPQPYAVTLTMGETNNTADFGYREYEVFGAGDPPEPGMIGDLVWEDMDGDGAFTPGLDLPLPGVTLLLRSLEGGPDRTATTGLDGRYLFTDLPLGGYTVEVSDAFGVLAGYLPTYPGSDTQAQPYETFLGLQSSDMDADFGYARPVQLGGVVYFDSNGNGLRDPGETNIDSGVPILLRHVGAGQEWTRLSDDLGYSLTGVLPGTYEVAAPPTLPGLALTSANMVTLTLLGGQAAMGIHFGYIAPAAVALVSFQASGDSTGVTLHWRTAAEQDLSGFVVWRALSAAGAYKAVSGLIPAQNSPTGAEYAWRDVTADTGVTYWYRLEVRPDGEWFGPVSVAPEPGDGGLQRLFTPLVLRSGR